MVHQKMKTPAILQNYEQWKHCITIDCGIQLTEEYISKRISLLQNNNDYYTQQFVKLYGQQYLNKVLNWFIQAQKST